MNKATAKFPLWNSKGERREPHGNAGTALHPAVSNNRVNEV
jgi:hypothetical protein